MSQEQETPDIEMIDRLDLHSADVAGSRREELLRLFPEAAGERGTIDLDQLRRALGDVVEAGKERYGMAWPGKADCFRTIQTPSTATLLPVAEESVEFDVTANVIIEGDNLEVLKLLQKSYLGQIKMIYIDPPYNTGNDFIYPDNFAESLQTYLAYTGQVDAEGRKFSTNPDTSGRFHTNWMNMMFPRLYLARNLLQEDGCIFVSIDDGELANLRRLCDEVFGEENFIATVIWQKVFSPKNSARHFSEDHDYIVVYARNAETWRPTLLPRTEAANARYTNPDNDPRGPWTSGDLTARNYYGEGSYSVTAPGGAVYKNPSGRYWGLSLQRFHELDEDRRLWWGTNRNSMPRLKNFLSEVKQGIIPQTLWMYGDVGHTQEAKQELLAAVPIEHNENVLNTVKPTRLIRRMLQVATTPSSNDLVLDFFAGSGATGDAVLAQNADDGGKRRFLLVQLPEPLPTPEPNLKSIADITKARVRAAGKSSASAAGQQTLAVGTPVDRGFRVFRLAESNFEVWEAARAEDAAGLQQQLQAHIEHIRPGRSEQDLLYELLLKSGFPLDSPAKKVDLANADAWSIQDGALIVCLIRDATLEQVRAIADAGPERVVMLDAAFAGNDQLKANAAQIFKSKNIAFKTV